VRAFYDAYRSERGEVWKCKEWPGNFMEYHHFLGIREMIGRLPEKFCRHKEPVTDT